MAIWTDLSAALLLLLDIAVICLILVAVIWVGQKAAGWLVPQRGGLAQQFEVVGGSAEQNVLWARLFQTELMQINRELESGEEAVKQLHEAVPPR